MPTAGSGVDAATVLALTGGNPFRVREVLASPDAVSAGVVDLVLARPQRLDPDSRDAVERLSVLTAAIEREVVDALVPQGLSALAGAEESGLLLVEPRRVRFRHELTRRAVLDALTTSRRTSLNAAALSVLETLPGVDPARLVHHARESGDADATVRHGPAAARAAATGARPPAGGRAPAYGPGPPRPARRRRAGRAARGLGRGVLHGRRPGTQRLGGPARGGRAVPRPGRSGRARVVVALALADRVVGRGPARRGAGGQRGRRGAGRDR